MPGSSLWLIPPRTHPLHKLLSDLITATIPACVPALTPPPFVPHVTLTSGLPESVPSPQKWLDELDFSAAGEVVVRFQALDVGKEFVKKLTLRVEKNDGLMELAGMGRREAEDGDREKVKEWLQQSYRPHCSLLYAGIEISHEKKAELESMVKDAGVNLDGNGEMGGWTGGSVWLVPTYKPFEEWKPVAVRDL